MLQGSVQVFIMNLHINTRAWQIIKFLENAGVKVMDIYMIQNEISGKFRGLVKTTLLGNNVMDNWLENGKAILGGVRRPIKRERKSVEVQQLLPF